MAPVMMAPPMMPAATPGPQPQPLPTPLGVSVRNRNGERAGDGGGRDQCSHSPFHDALLGAIGRKPSAVYEKCETSQNAPMRLNEPVNNPLSICRNFGGFEGIYEQEFNVRTTQDHGYAFRCVEALQKGSLQATTCRLLVHWIGE